MYLSIAFRPTFRQIRHPLNQSRKVHTEIEPVNLAYDLHLPPSKNVTSNATRSPILFLHGLFGSKKNNRTISRVLARDLNRPVYALDSRNHGASPQSPIHTYPAMAADVKHFIESHQLVNTTIIGHSMGAKTAMTTVLQYPDIVEDIVAVDNAPLDTSLGSNFPKYIHGMLEIERIGTKRLTDADHILAKYEPSLVIRQFLLGNLHRKDVSSPTLKFRIPLQILAKSFADLGDFPFKDPTSIRCEKRALFVRGTKSKYVPDEAIPLIGQFFPRFQLVDIDADHWVISEQPEIFRQSVINFLLPQE